MRQNLGARLSRMRSSKPQKKDLSTTPASVHSPGDDWEKIGRYTFSRIITVPDPVSALGLGNPFAGNLLFKTMADSPTPGELVFFDLETTGLSAAPGTVVFLAGFGRILDTRLVITQFFLSDYPGEGEFLGVIKKYIPPNPFWISYNGKTFDAPMLISKGILHGIRFMFPRHGDLLHLSRRLWKGILPDCSLSSVEDHILSVERQLDIPGAMAPQIYFDYLRTGETGEIQKIAAHHYEDIFSLARLLAKICEISHDPEGAQPADAYGLGTLLENDAVGEGILRRGFREGSLRCGRFLARRYKREGRYREAVEIWERASSIYGCSESEVELAMYYEHRLKDLDAAEFWTRKAFKNAKNDLDKMHNELTRRLERIQRKKLNSV